METKKNVSKRNEHISEYDFSRRKNKKETEKNPTENCAMLPKCPVMLPFL